jgi:hypothetical protein
LQSEGEDVKQQRRQRFDRQRTRDRTQFEESENTHTPQINLQKEQAEDEPTIVEPSKENFFLPNSTEPLPARTLRAEINRNQTTDNVFIESAITGKFVKATKDKTKKEDPIQQGATMNAFKVFTTEITKMICTVGGISQGLLAGTKHYTFGAD